MLLEPGMSLPLRPMRYPDFFERNKDAIKNTWTVDEVDFATDLTDLRSRVTPAERHLIHPAGRVLRHRRFDRRATIWSSTCTSTSTRWRRGCTCRVNCTRRRLARPVLSHPARQLPAGRGRAARPRSPRWTTSCRSNGRKAEFCFTWIDSIEGLDRLESRADRRAFLLNLICFAACIEGLFFFAAFVYVYFLRSKGLLHGLAAGTNWVFRDESAHMAFAFRVIDTVRREEPNLFDAELEAQVVAMLREAVACETEFARDVLGMGVAGLSLTDLRSYLEYVADRRLEALGIAPVFGSKNPFDFMDLQDVQELTNFFERRVSAYQHRRDGSRRVRRRLRAARSELTLRCGRQKCPWS